MKLKQVLSRTASAEDLNVRKHTPWIVNPLDRNASQGLAEHSMRSETKLNPNNRVLEFDETHVPHSNHGLPIFKHHKESSTVELFYDLFFVANLATFTSNHEIRDVDSLKNYIGFFTLLWFTWLETSLFDVRFSSDSVFMRVCKAVSFGVMTGFAISGSIYDTTQIGENAKAFRAMAIILMVSRLALFVQYGVILWYVRGYKKTLVPLGGTMLALFVSAMIFLGTFWGFPHGKAEASFPIEHSGPQVYIAWYVVVCIEAAAIITISCIWRVVSFKHTHLVERIGLLTLIIMGEGIIGMTKSVSTILQNSSAISPSDIGVVVAAVLLIYFVWVLYFDQIEHDRFGTIRQQIWAILHFPLHAALLLTVEGSTTLIIWNIIAQDNSLWWGLYPTGAYYTFEQYFDGKTQFIEYLKYATETFASRFKEGSIIGAYDYTVNITSIQNTKGKWGSDEYDNTVGPIIDQMWFSLDNLIYKNFDIELPETAGKKVDVFDDTNQLFNVFNVVWVYFYISAGLFLIVLATMYWFGKTHKSRGEFISIGVRIISGILVALPCMTVWYFTVPATNFAYSAWHIPIVMLVFFVVIVLDNLLVWHTNKTISRQTAAQDEGYSLTDSLSKRGGNSREEGSREETLPAVTQEV